MARPSPGPFRDLATRIFERFVPPRQTYGHDPLLDTTGSLLESKIVLVEQGAGELGDSGLDPALQESCVRQSYHSAANPAQSNLIVVDLFVHLGHNPYVESHAPVSLRRCLIDTGSELNLISYDAAHDLGIHITPTSGKVISVTGESSLCGTLKLNWHLRSRRCLGTMFRTVHQTEFCVLDRHAGPLFDCLLGQPWIAENEWFMCKLYFRRCLQKLLAALPPRLGTSRDHRWNVSAEHQTSCMVP